MKMAQWGIIGCIVVAQMEEATNDGADRAGERVTGATVANHLPFVAIFLGNKGQANEGDRGQIGYRGRRVLDLGVVDP